jgi:integrase
VARTKKVIPSYSFHKSSGNARVRIDGRDFYLGKYGSEKSRLRYVEVVKQQTSGVASDPVIQHGKDDTGPTVNELTNAFLTFAKQHYRKNGKPTAEVDCIKSAMRPLVDLFGHTPAKSFGPASLKAVRQQMLDGGTMCREYVNKSVGRIRRIFRYGVECELVPPPVLTGLEAVSPLLAGRTTAIDHAPRTAVPIKRLEAVRQFVNEETRDMIDLAVLTGARPGELVSLTTDVLDRTADVWVAVLADHKMIHKGKPRVLVFGPRAQLILKKYIRGNGAAKLFPIERATFSNRLKRACDRLKLPRFTGHWLRHTAGSNIRESHGLDGAQVTLGHSSASMTEVYAHLNVTKAMEIARECG